MIDSFIQKLRAEGYRVTPQRTVILQILSDSGGHLTPVEIFQSAKRMLPGMTEATVYRTLNFLSQHGFVLAAHIGNGQLVYEITGRAHHHLICRACGHTHEIDHQLLKALYEQFQEKTGYQIDTLHVTFFGLCLGCQSETKL